jgi:hypothetical protein
VQAVIERGLQFIESVQQSNGEIPTYKHVLDKELMIYASSPFISTFVHDAISSIKNDRTIKICRKIKRFLRKEMEEDYTWRFFGKHARIDSDSDCTACCAFILVQDGDTPEKFVKSLGSFKDDSGLYYSYRDKNGTQYSWIAEGGRVIIGFDRVVNANIARFLISNEIPCDNLILYLLDEIKNGPTDLGSPDYPYTITWFYMISRALWQVGKDFLNVNDILLDSMRAADIEENALNCAMRALTHIYLGSPPLECDLEYLFNSQKQDGGWNASPFFVGDYGSRGLTTALAIEAIFRERAEKNG